MTKRLTTIPWAWIRVALVAFVLLLLSRTAAAQEECEDNGVVLGFFNGVATDEKDAQRALDEMAALYRDTSPKGDPITYELFYNDTEGRADFVEVFEQRLQEQNGLQAGRFELFFSALNGGGTWWSSITNAIPAAQEVLTALADGYLAAVAHVLTGKLGNANTFEVAQRHREQIDLWIGMDRRLLLVAHSQGNLFVNAAYDHALSKTKAESVKVVHIAPASSRVVGAYSLADKDIVINPLRALGGVPPNTHVIPPYVHRPPGLNGEKDIWGHGLLSIYLNPSVPTSGTIHEQILAALDALQSPEKTPKDPFPDFVSIPWTGGVKPEPVIVPGSNSHEFGVREVTRTPGLYWERLDASRWTFSGTLNVSDYDRGINETWKAKVTGRGVEGSAECKRSLRRVEHLFGPSVVGRIECVYRNYFTGATGSPGWGFSESTQPWELGPYGQGTPPGGAVQLSTQTYVAQRGFQVNEQLHFISGTYLLETELEPKVNDYGRAYSQLVRKTDINTVTRRSEVFTATPSAVQNLHELHRWETAYGAWRAREDLRIAHYMLAKEAYDRYRQQCSPPPPPPPPVDDDCPPDMSSCEGPQPV